MNINSNDFFFKWSTDFQGYFNLEYVHLEHLLKVKKNVELTTGILFQRFENKMGFHDD